MSKVLADILFGCVFGFIILGVLFLFREAVVGMTSAVKYEDRSCLINCGTFFNKGDRP